MMITWQAYVWKNEDNIHTSDLHSEPRLVQNSYNTLFLQIPLCFIALSCEMSDPASQVSNAQFFKLSAFGLEWDYSDYV